jgi:transposase
MARRPRRNHTAVFKAKVALEALEEDQTLVELSERFQVYPNQIAEWKKILLEKASDVFDKGKSSGREPDIKELHAKIGQLAMTRNLILCYSICMIAAKENTMSTQSGMTCDSHCESHVILKHGLTSWQSIHCPCKKLIYQKDIETRGGEINEECGTRDLPSYPCCAGALIQWWKSQP